MGFATTVTAKAPTPGDRDATDIARLVVERREGGVRVITPITAFTGREGNTPTAGYDRTARLTAADLVFQHARMVFQATPEAYPSLARLAVRRTAGVNLALAFPTTEPVIVCNEFLADMTQSVLMGGRSRGRLGDPTAVIPRRNGNTPTAGSDNTAGRRLSRPGLGLVLGLRTFSLSL